MARSAARPSRQEPRSVSEWPDVTFIENSKWSSGLRNNAVNLLLFLSIPGIGFIDALAGKEIRLTAFFLIPITLITWRLGRWPGYGATFAAAAILLGVALMHGAIDTSTSLFIVDVAGRFVAFFVVVAILASLRDQYIEQRTLATRDSLTGLHNRAGLRAILDVEFERCRRNGQPSALLFLDCDNFKYVNDHWGHGTGDALLQTVAQSLLRTVRSSDVVCRLGGDEFVLFLAETGSPESETLAHKVRTELDKAMLQQHWPVSFSVGVAFFAEPPDTAEEGLDFADALMYQAKLAGKNSMRCAHFRRKHDS